MPFILHREVDGLEARLRGDRPDLYACLADESELADELIEDWRESKQRFVRAFAIAAAVFAIVWFGGQLLRGALS